MNSTIMKESDIRDLVAQNLNQIDHKLRLVSKEHRICLRDGQTAVIDILAKDVFGYYTVIEIKKSNKSARTTVQQLFKYAHFLKKHNRLRHDQIRCVALSTEWDELRAPFGEYKHFCSYESHGYLLTVGCDDRLKFEEIDPQYETGGNDPLSGFSFFEFFDPQVRNEHYQSLKGLLLSVPSQNSFMISMDYEGSDPRVIHRAGIAWVCFAGDLEGIYQEIKELCSRQNSKFEARSQLNEPLFASVEDCGPEEGDAWDDLWCAQIIHLHGPILQSDGEVAYFDMSSLNNILRQWRWTELEKFGPMFEGDLYDQREVLRMACGHQGRHPYNFVASTSPTRPNHFMHIRNKLDGFLASNRRWRRAVNFLLADMLDHDDVEVIVYNPLNVFGTLRDLAEEGSSSRLPLLKLNLHRTGGAHYDCVGGLYWTKNVKYISPSRAVKRAYPSLDVFYLRTIAHQLNAYDEGLAELYGLTFEVTRKMNAQVERLVLDEDAPKWVLSGGLRDLQTFVDHHPDLISDVFRLYEFLGRSIA